MGKASSSPPPIGGRPTTSLFTYRLRKPGRNGQNLTIKTGLDGTWGKETEKKKTTWIGLRSVFLKDVNLQLQDSRLHFYLTSRFGKIAGLIKFWLGIEVPCWCALAKKVWIMCIFDLAFVLISHVCVNFYCLNIRIHGWHPKSIGIVGRWTLQCDTVIHICCWLFFFRTRSAKKKHPKEIIPEICVLNTFEIHITYPWKTSCC